MVTSAKETTPETYGTGLLCPRADSQVAFYTEDNQQDAAGTIAFETGGGFIITAGNIKNLEAAGAHPMEGLCEGGLPGIRIDAKRDGWLQAGRMWLPPNQEWDYGDWQDYLRKAAIWKLLAPTALYQGTGDGPLRDRPYPDAEAKAGQDVYPLKVTDEFALVLVDEAGAYAKTCAGTPTPPHGRLGWMRLTSDDGKPAAVPTHAKGC